MTSAASEMRLLIQYGRNDVKVCVKLESNKLTRDEVYSDVFFPNDVGFRCCLLSKGPVESKQQRNPTTITHNEVERTPFHSMT